jgi:hypothetical protein
LEVAGANLFSGNNKTGGGLPSVINAVTVSRTSPAPATSR